jgi:predicted esterase
MTCRKALETTLRTARAFRVSLVVALLASHILGPSLGLAVTFDFAPSIGQKIEINDWHFLGPFSIGPREGVIGITDDPAAMRPDDASYVSTLVQGGYVTWGETQPDSTGWVYIEYENVPWDTLMDVYGYAGIVTGAYAYAEFEVPQESRALIRAERIGSFYLNGRLYHGDPYGHGFTRVPVNLKGRINRVILKLSGFGDHRFKFEVLPVPAPVMLLDDYTVPDIIEGERGTFWIGISLLNTTHKRIDNLTLAVGGGLTREAEHTLTNLVPHCVKKVPIRVELTAPVHLTDAAETNKIDIPVSVSYHGYAFRDTVSMRIRRKGESFKRTFISSIDNSCQYYAVLPPFDYDPGSQYALILTLHGAGVEAGDQVDAYKSKPWAFVAAPTNRRRFGFDWQDWGRLDALEVLKDATASLPIDTDRIYLTGHSMGGHGAWHVGLTHADMFAALAPAAGWTSFELYVPWFLQKAYLHGEAGQQAIRAMSLRQDWPLSFVENALNLPVFILQGGSDDNVPPVHARMFAERLEDLGYPYEYKEDPGRGHWYSIDSLDVACVDDPDLMHFFQGKVRDPFPRHVVFSTTNVAHAGRSFWLEITRQQKPYHVSRIEGHVKDRTIEIVTSNIGEFRISLSEDLIPHGRIEALIDGRKHRITHTDERVITFARRGGQFRPGAVPRPGFSKSPQLYGPIRQAYFSPFVLVYGTQGDAHTADLLLHQARLEAYQWWRRGNGLVEILPDIEVTPDIVSAYNLILFGGTSENLITSRIERHLPIRRRDDSFVVGGIEVDGESLAAKFIYPNPLNRHRLVVVHEGCGYEGLRLSTFVTTLYAGAGLPDFIVFDKSVMRLGWGGMIAAGFFDTDWEIDKTLMYLRQQ